jgi:hypothetical protein
MYDLIYANGDSFAAGRDLAEKQYWPEARLLSWTEWQEFSPKLQKLYEKFEKEYSTRLDLALYPQERNMAYSAQLGKLTNTKTINNSTSGAGHTNIALQTIRDLNELRKDHKKILVLIGLSNVGRIWFPNSEPSNPNHTLILGRHGGYKTKFEQKISEHWIEHTDSIDLHVNMAISMLAIDNFCKQNNIDMYFVGCPLFNKNQFDQIQGFDISNYLCDKTIGYLGGDYHSYEKNETRYTGSGHLPLSDHIELAEQLKEKLWT